MIVTSTLHGPGTRMLADYLRTPDPRATLLSRHPYGRPDHDRAADLVRAAEELDFRHREVQRTEAALTAGRTSAAERHVSGAGPALAELAAHLRAALRNRGNADAALTVLLAAHRARSTVRGSRNPALPAPGPRTWHTYRRGVSARPGGVRPLLRRIFLDAPYNYPRVP